MYIQYRTLPAYLIPQAPRMISTIGYLYSAPCRFALGLVKQSIFCSVELSPCMLLQKGPSMHSITGSFYVQYCWLLPCLVQFTPLVFCTARSQYVQYSRSLYEYVPVCFVQQDPCIFSQASALYVQSSLLHVFSVEQGPCIYVCMSDAQFYPLQRQIRE